jgi:membrane protein
MKVTQAVPLLKETFNQWWADNVPRLSAALAYYTLFSLAPLVIITVAVAGFAFGREAATGQLYAQINQLVGADGARAIQSVVDSANQPGTGTVALVFGVLTLLAGASGAFVALQDALNTIWGVQPNPEQSTVRGFIRSRLLSFAMVLGIGFLLLVSLVITAALAFLGKYMATVLPIPPGALYVMNLGVSLSVITALFALIFKLLPDAHFSWRDVWVGAAMTAVLFTLGQFLIGLYLGRGSVGSAFGAAASLVVVLVWVYYSAQVVLFGAEFTQVYVNKYGAGSRPAAGATSSGTRRAAELLHFPSRVQRGWSAMAADERKPT